MTEPRENLKLTSEEKELARQWRLKKLEEYRANPDSHPKWCIEALIKRFGVESDE